MVGSAAPPPRSGHPYRAPRGAPSRVRAQGGKILAGGNRRLADEGPEGTVLAVDLEAWAAARWPDVPFPWVPDDVERMVE